MTSKNISDVSVSVRDSVSRISLSRFIIGLVCLLFGSQNLYAVEVEVVGPCDPKPALEVYVELKNEITLGDLTVKVLNDHRIPFKGDAQGIAQIDDSPIGNDAIEPLSSTEMRAYGWCVHVDDEEPAEMPDKVIITQKVKKISWFYAYSLYDNGAWKDYCTPSWKVHSLKYCQSK